VSLLYAGWDEHYGFQLYQSDPSGNYGGWKAVAIGAGNQAANNLLKADYKVGAIHQAYYRSDTMAWGHGWGCSQTRVGGTLNARAAAPKPVSGVKSARRLPAAAPNHRVPKPSYHYGIHGRAPAIPARLRMSPNNRHDAWRLTLPPHLQEDLTIAEALPLLIKVLAKTMDTSLSPEKVELSTLTKDGDTVQFKIYEADEMKPLLDAANEAKLADAAL
jgi:hypothetical protein